MELLNRFQQSLAGFELEDRRGLVAVSGGPDSVALLDLLARTADGHRLTLIVAHLDHGIHQGSSRVAEQVVQLARSYGLPAEVGRVELGPKASETDARASRYRWLESLRVRVGADLILTAHHADDQAETVLMRLLAGSGPAGLAGMAPMTGFVVRPLLSFRRTELTSYLRQRGLTAWTDPANADPRHLRSWIRTEIIPLLHQRVPDLHQHLARVASQAGRDRTAWNEVLDALPELDVRVEHGTISVAASALAGYDSQLAQSLVLAAARRVGCTLGPSRIGRIFDLLDHQWSGARAPLGFGWWAELSFGRLRIARDQPAETSSSWDLAGHHGEREWGRWVFRWQLGTAPAQQERTGLSAWFTPDPLTVRSWTAGERLRPLGGTGRRLIVRCLQEGRVPRSRRGTWPVLAESAEVIWIPGVCRSDARIPAAGTEALRVDAEYA